MLKKLSIISLLIIAIVIPQVIAQIPAGDLSTSILRFFGRLPAVCQNTLLTSDCIYCFGYVKVLPFLFFFAIVYLFIAYAILSSAKVPGERGEQHPVMMRQVPTYQGIAILLSMIVAILILNLPPFDTGIPEFLSRIQNFQNFLFYIFGLVISITFIWQIIQGLNEFIRIAIIIAILGLITNFFIFAQGTFTNPVAVIDNPCFLV